MGELATPKLSISTVQHGRRRAAPVVLRRMTEGMLAGCHERIGCCSPQRQEVSHDPSACVWCNGRCLRFRCGDGRTRLRAAAGWEPPAAGTRAGRLSRWDVWFVALMCAAERKDKYVLARPKRGPVASVPEASCTADPGADALMVDNPEKGNITDSALGRWVEIGGRLEKETSTDPDNLRELDVATFKLVPVVVPPPPARHRGRRHRHRPQGQRRRRLNPQRQPQSLVTCRRRRASFQRLDWPGCSRLQQASCFVRSVSGDEVDAADTDSDRGHDSLSGWVPPTIRGGRQKRATSRCKL